MRVIIGAFFLVTTLGVFVAVTAAMFIAQHVFAISVLGSVVVAVLFLARRTKHRRERWRVPAQGPAPYPAILAPARRAAGATPKRAAHGMSSAALPSRARRSLAPRRSYP